MRLDRYVTDAAGLVIIVVGLISLTESLLQVQVVGSRMPMAQGTVISLFTVSFGTVLLTRSATEAFERIRNLWLEKFSN